MRRQFSGRARWCYGAPPLLPGQRAHQPVEVTGEARRRLQLDHAPNIPLPAPVRGLHPVLQLAEHLPALLVVALGALRFRASAGDERERVGLTAEQGRRPARAIEGGHRHRDVEFLRGRRSGGLHGFPRNAARARSRNRQPLSDAAAKRQLVGGRPSSSSRSSSPRLTAGACARRFQARVRDREKSEGAGCRKQNNSTWSEVAIIAEPSRRRWLPGLA